MKPVRHKEAKSEQAKLVVDDVYLVSDPSPETEEDAVEETEEVLVDEETSKDSLNETKGEIPDPDIGRIVAQQYQLLERIGEGGMSTVYRAKHLALDKEILNQEIPEQEVAVKLLAQPRTKDP